MEALDRKGQVRVFDRLSSPKLILRLALSLVVGTGGQQLVVEG